jgi:anti-sigma factor RsiW
LTIDNDSWILLNSYHDGELSPVETLAMEERLRREPELAASLAALQNLSKQARASVPGGPAPDTLRASVLAAIGGPDLEERAPDARMTTRSPAWLAIAASLIVGAVVGAAAGIFGATYVMAPETPNAVAGEIASAHLRALIAPLPFDVASSDSHVVKPWFNGKTTIAPTTPDFAAQGFPLIGGRIDIIAGKAVPVMVYKRNRHTISVTVTEEGRSQPPATQAIEGTNILPFAGAGLTYWAVSDLNPTELRQFAELYQRQLSAAK